VTPEPERRPFAHLERALSAPRPLPSEAEDAGSLPPVFQFSQQSLQTYVDCARRFQLRYVLGQRWPAPQSEPLHEYEAMLERGSQFHLLVQRHLLGIPPEQLTPADPDLAAWWDAYLRTPPPDLPEAARMPEVQMSIPVGDQRLLARYDLLAIDPGQRAVIVDWKTAHVRPDRAELANRLQSHVYPYVLVEAGAYLFGGPVHPDQVSLVYWFAQDPNRPEVFQYSAARHAEDAAYLSDLIAEIVARDPTQVWELTLEESRCQYCIYRSLCNRGVTAGPLESADLDEPGFDFDFDLDEIEEIAF